MRPTRCLGDRAGRTTGRIELPKARVGIGLQDPGVARQKGLRVLTPAIRRVEVGCRWWSRPAKGPDTVGEIAGLAESSTYVGKFARIVASIRTEKRLLSFPVQP